MQLVDHLAHPLLVGPADDQRTRAVLEDLLDRDDLAGDLVAAGEHDVERLVEHDLAPRRARRGRPRAAAPPASCGRRSSTSTVSSSLMPDDRAVGRRRLGELLDLLAERGDVLARLTQGVAKLLVLGDRLGELALRLEQPLLERAHPLRCVLQLAPQRRRPLPRGASPAPAAPRARLSYAASRRSYSARPRATSLASACAGRYTGALAIRRGHAYRTVDTVSRAVDRMRCFTGRSAV